MNQKYRFLKNSLLFTEHILAQEGFVNAASSYPGEENHPGWKEFETDKIGSNQRDQLPLI